MTAQMDPAKVPGAKPAAEDNLQKLPLPEVEKRLELVAGWPSRCFNCSSRRSSPIGSHR